MSWVNKYIGIRHVKHGRDMEGLDCWGLCRLVLAQECGIKIPSYLDIDYADSQLVERAIDVGAASSDWIDVLPRNTEPFDFVTMKSPVSIGGFLRNAVVHVGIVVIPGAILHTEEKIGAVVQATSELELRIHRYKRHRLMCDVRAA